MYKSIIKHKNQNNFIKSKNDVYLMINLIFLTQNNITVNLNNHNNQMIYLYSIKINKNNKCKNKTYLNVNINDKFFYIQVKEILFNLNKYKRYHKNLITLKIKFYLNNIIIMFIKIYS
jgi:hypothetical protein